MSKLMRFFAIAALIVGALALVPDIAQARHGGHGGHGGGFRGGGGWGWGPGWGWGGYPYPYYGAYYGGGCGYVRVWRRGHWVLRRSYRCY